MAHKSGSSKKSKSSSKPKKAVAAIPPTFRERLSVRFEKADNDNGFVASSYCLYIDQEGS